MSTAACLKYLYVQSPIANSLALCIFSSSYSPWSYTWVHKLSKETHMPWIHQTTFLWHMPIKSGLLEFLEGYGHILQYNSWNTVEAYKRKRHSKKFSSQHSYQLSHTNSHWKKDINSSIIHLACFLSCLAL